MLLSQSDARPAAIISVLYPALAMFGGLGLLGKIGLLHTFSASHQHLVLAALLLWIVSALFWRQVLQVREYVAPVVIIGLVLCPLIVLPRAERLHASGRGTDQPACIVAAGQRMWHGQWPYDRSQMWSGNPMSCGPGWVAIQSPLVKTVGYAWTLVLVSAVSVTILVSCWGWHRASSALSLLALAPGLWIAACDGSDFLPFGLLVAVLCLLRPQSRWLAMLLAIVLGLVSQFRTATVPLPATQITRLGRLEVTLASTIAIGTTALFLLHNPAKFIQDGPMHLFSKLTGADLHFGTPAGLTLLYVLLAAAASCAVGLLARRLSSQTVLLAYLLTIFVLPAVMNLIITLRLRGLHASSLGLWEGGNWFVGVLPLTAIMFVETNITKEGELSQVAQPVNAREAALVEA